MEDRFHHHFVSKTDFYVLGRDRELERYFLGIVVGIPHFDWHEYYALSDDEYQSLMADVDAACAFAGRCRAREMDDRLILPPRPYRGDPWEPL